MTFPETIKLQSNCVGFKENIQLHGTIIWLLPNFLFFKFILTVFNYVYVCADMYICVQVPTETMSDLLGTTVTDGCGTWYGCWELNLGPPGE